MSDALVRMAAFLIQAEPWKPDRGGAQKEKTCCRCKKQKVMEKFSPASSMCKVCHTALSQEWREKRKRGAAGKWSA
jgi:hypothetical protein